MLLILFFVNYIIATEKRERSMKSIRMREKTKLKSNINNIYKKLMQFIKSIEDKKRKKKIFNKSTLALHAVKQVGYEKIEHKQYFLKNKIKLIEKYFPFSLHKSIF
jgi:hypothetical protein